jgi:coenzyme F420 biosynthesis associated uncharacterized protein
MADGSGSPAGLVDWALAQRVADWAVARNAAPDAYRDPAVQAEFDELTAQAEELVVSATGLRSPDGPARARVVGRSDWVAVNVAAIDRLLSPTLRKLESRRATSPALALLPAWVPERLAGAGRAVSGAQFGLVLSWMSSRVLGQYDLLVTDDTPDEQDIVYYVGPNVLSLEERYGFVARQFRLWLALHEVTHRCQFTGVPWLRDHFVSLVNAGLEPMATDPARLTEAVRRAAEGLRSGHSPMGDAGMIGLVATPEQLEAIQGLQAMMSLLEGHGDVVMDRAGAGAVPGAERFSRILRERRLQVRGPAKLVQQVLGLEAKLRQYAEGEKFVTAVEAAGGIELFNRVWQGPEWLPSLVEIRDPELWIDRARSAPARAG